jgi:hypothetical protein
VCSLPLRLISCGHSLLASRARGENRRAEAQVLVLVLPVRSTSALHFADLASESPKNTLRTPLASETDVSGSSSRGSQKGESKEGRIFGVALEELYKKSTCHILSLSLICPLSLFHSPVSFASTFDKSASDRAPAKAEIPPVLQVCYEYLLAESRLEMEGVFRISGEYSEVQNLKQLFDSGRSTFSSSLSLSLFYFLFRVLTVASQPNCLQRHILTTSRRSSRRSSWTSPSLS